MTTTTVLSDTDLQRDVLNELKWDPRVNAAQIGVSVKDGVVTLTGEVSSYPEAYAAVHAAMRVHGVKGVANELRVKLPGSSERSDHDIAADAILELKSNSWVPADQIKVSVSDGWVKLEGEVEWYYQKEAAENSVRFLRGVKGVSNLIRIRPRVSPAGLQSKIRDAITRSAEMDARRIRVEAQGNKIILRGTVYSLAEKLEAERAAWSAPGVSEVENQIVVVERKPVWLWVTVLVVILALLVVLVAIPMLVFHGR